MHIYSIFICDNYRYIPHARVVYVNTPVPFVPDENSDKPRDHWARAYAINSISLKLEFVYYAIVRGRLPHFRTKSVRGEYTADRFTWVYWLLYFNLGH